jgi:8-oxo-dGTP pyrophosphatase MutT (NUDIX family)
VTPMDATRRLPRGLAERAVAYAAGGMTPVDPKDAATVVLVRDGNRQIEAYLLRRHHEMAFAAGMYVFPGGVVDRRDSDPALAWAGPSDAEWAERLHCDEPTARALVCAAVRETFEESGVLLAGPTGDSVVADTTGADWEADRQRLVDRTLPFSDLLAIRDLVLRTDLLAACGHWITPEFEPRRYDTRFFVAELPAGQRTRDVSGESDRVAWMTPRAACAGVDARQMAMLPPTYATLSQMSGIDRASVAVAAARDRAITAIMPTVEVIDGESWLAVPETAAEPWLVRDG